MGNSGLLKIKPNDSFIRQIVLINRDYIKGKSQWSVCKLKISSDMEMQDSPYLELFI